MTDKLTKTIEVLSEAFEKIGEAIKKLLKPFLIFSNERIKSRLNIVSQKTES